MESLHQRVFSIIVAQRTAPTLFSFNKPWKVAEIYKVFISLCILSFSRVFHENMLFSRTYVGVSFMFESVSSVLHHFANIMYVKVRKEGEK